jgi:ABC-type multidrug transport system fused ATPase/permease subunit
MKSLNATNSGKLVSLISSDLFQTEKGVAFIPQIVAGPCVTAIAICLIGFYYKWVYALITFGVWFITLIL